MKTIRQLLENLPTDLAAKAIRAAEMTAPKMLSELVPNLATAIRKGIAWGDTVEGYRFWDDAWFTARRGAYSNSNTPETDKHLEEQVQNTSIYMASPEFTRRLEEECNGLLERVKELESERDKIVALSKELLRAFEEVLDGLGFLTGGDHELEGLAIAEERGSEIRALLVQSWEALGDD